jgi:hypothetical protein
MNTTTATEVEYLKDIKFRNAVKKATRFRVSGKTKTDRGSFVIRAFHSGDNNDRFTITYYYGGFGGDRADVINLKKELEFQRDLFMAGFEGEYVEEHVRGEIEKVFVWKKAA